MLRFIHVTFYTCNLWRILSTSANHICEGNTPVTGEIPPQRPVTRNFDVFFDLRLNKRFSKQSRHRWSETPSRSLWHHCNVASSGNIELKTPDLAKAGSHGGTCTLEFVSGWRHQMEFFPRYWPYARGIHQSSVDSPHKSWNYYTIYSSFGQRSMTRGVGVFFRLRLNKRLSKQSRRRWSLRSLWRHFDVQMNTVVRLWSNIFSTLN